MRAMQFDLHIAQRLLRDPTIQVPTIAAVFGQSVAVFATYYKRFTKRLEQAADGSANPDGHNYGDYRLHHLPDGAADGCRLELIVKPEHLEEVGPKIIAAMGRGKFADTLMKLLISEAPCSTTDTSKGSDAPKRKKTSRRGSSR